MDERFARQIIMPELSSAGQKKLQQSSVLVVGAGGLGCAALTYLAAAGVGKIEIFDGDKVEISNLHRQILFSELDIGIFKAETAARFLQTRYPTSKFDYTNSKFTVSNSEIVSDFDLILDCTDNFLSKYLINDVCVANNKPFISASITSFSGQLGLFNLITSKFKSGTYRCLFPDLPNSDEAPSCAENGVIGFIPGVFGTLQACEAIKVLAGILDNLANKLLVLDLRNYKQTLFSYDRIEDRIDYKVKDQNYYESLMKTCSKYIDLAPSEFKEKLNSSEPYFLLDVREKFESEICTLGGNLIPLKSLALQIDTLPRDRNLLVYCHLGGRSAKACEELVRQGFDRVFNLSGGIARYTDEIDSSLVKY